MSPRKIVISINASWNIVNFRRGLIRALQQAGYQVIALAPRDEYSSRFAELGVEYRAIEIDQQGASPARDFALLARYYKALREIRPVAYLGYTAKPNIYGSLAAHALGIPGDQQCRGPGYGLHQEGPADPDRIRPVSPRIPALGHRFLPEPRRSRHVRRGRHRPARSGQAATGIRHQLDRFHAGAGQAGGRAIHIPADRASAVGQGRARVCRGGAAGPGEAPDSRFHLLGFLDVPNRTAVTRSEVDAWVTEGLIEYLGSSDDVRPFIAAADCVVLPSYREGLPRVLLEGSAMGRPLIASDVPGCRDVVEDGRNGFLCKVRDPASLAEAMLRMMQLPLEERLAMGDAARRKVETEFDERIAVGRYLDALGG
jgi:hypothetical protein